MYGNQPHVSHTYNMKYGWYTLSHQCRYNNARRVYSYWTSNHYFIQYIRIKHYIILRVTP